ncbi:hypothetical protein JIR23_23670 [Bradyrhizobium diazoefficiens]|nr:hypothetical protein [Bradyrhizobium diazoefficiens]QQN62543.1 hypothetical protein JIR23_23670 [Bradyrhizobium diazoefficiens]
MEPETQFHFDSAILSRGSPNMNRVPGLMASSSDTVPANQNASIGSVFWNPISLVSNCARLPDFRELPAI